ncbi:YitT family protein [Vallitalea okinawensis]|uniref:YitT family protein n=1 Tax=Vallitalea okinawensis TaxID=2078660 RepID=UPI000CFDD190|nr:YitT family protein [Vallitalea okinawensis]
MDKKIKTLKRIIVLLVGQFIAAAAFNQILVPNNLVPVGLGGLATVINNLTGLNVQLLLMLLSLPIIIWAFLKYERKQVYYAAFCFWLFTFYIGFVDKILPTFLTDPIIASIFGGVLLGVAGGMVIRQGVANGPEAIVGLYLKEKKDITVGNFFMVINTIIIFSSIIYGDLTLIIYSLISTYIASKVTDVVILGSHKIFIVNIMSDNYLEITEFIHKELDRGVTFVQSLDTHSVKKKMLIKTVITKTELIELKNYIHNLDDDSFVYVTESAGVIGGGFTA